MTEKLVLPKIEHPLMRHSADDITHLAVRGLSRRTPRHPSLSPEMDAANRSKSRGRSLSEQVDQVCRRVAVRLRGPGYYALRHGFLSFDPSGRGSISRPALARVLANQGLVERPALVEALLERVGLAGKDVISFVQFYSKFHSRPQSCPHWLDPVSRHSPQTMTANQITDVLRERARQKLILSDIFPFPRGPPHAIVKPELMNMINSLGLQATEEELDKLWKRLDPEGQGSLSMEKLLQRLGIVFKGPHQLSGTRPHTTAQGLTPSGEGQGAGAKEGGEFDAAFLEIKSCLHGNWASVLKSLKDIDLACTGKVTVEDLRRVLYAYGIQTTPGHMTELLQRLDMGGGPMVQYQELLKRFMACCHGSISDSVLQSTELKPPLAPGRVCTSVGDVESRLISVLQGRFLQLVALLRGCDPRGRGLVRREEFLSCLAEALGRPVPNPQQLVESVGEVEPGWVVYPKFLMKFDPQSGEGSSAPFSVGENPAVAAAGHASRTPPRPHNQACGGREGEFLGKVQKLIRSRPQLVYQMLEEMDQYNTGRLKEEQFHTLLARLGVVGSPEEWRGLWRGIIKDKYLAVDHHQLIRHFIGNQTVPILSDRHWSEDHCFQRSLKLHRDEDMVIERLKAQLRYYYSSAVKHFEGHDTDGIGHVTSHDFWEIICKLSPELSEEEVENIARKFTDQETGLVNYQRFMAPYHPKDRLHRDGYNMLMVLGHRQGAGLASPPPPTLHPQHDTPGPVPALRQKIGKNWRCLQRSLKRIDPEGRGCVSVSLFFSCLQSVCGVNLTPPERTAVHEVLDPQLNDSVNYVEFLRAFLHGGEVK